MDDTSPREKKHSPSMPSMANKFEHGENPALHSSAAVWESRQPYCDPGFRGLFSSSYVVLCAAFATLGGLLFGYDQGVVSVVLVEDQFTQRFMRIGEASPGSGFWKGLLTAMIELGALLGALNQGWIADKISRKYSIVVAVVIFTIGSILQTAAMDYAMLVVARFIGGVGIGMLSMVAPLYISEISPPEIRGALLVLEEFSIVTGIVIGKSSVRSVSSTYLTDESISSVLDYLRDILLAIRMGMAPPFSAADRSRPGPWYRHRLPSVQSPLACPPWPRSRSTGEPRQASQAAHRRLPSAAGMVRHPRRSSSAETDQRREAPTPSRAHARK